MGWNTSHGVIMRSYTSHEALGQQIAKVTTAAQWTTVAALFNRGNGEPFSVAPADAGAMAEVLETVARLVPQDWESACYGLAAAAHNAYDAGQPWLWS